MCCVPWCVRLRALTLAPPLRSWNKTLGGKKFTSRDEIITFARSLIQQKPASADDDASADAPTASSGADGELDAAAQSFVLDLLEHHERPAEKKGCGESRRTCRTAPTSSRMC